MKVYCYFLIDDPNELYAYTSYKEYNELFKEQRNMDCFIYGKKNFDDLEYKVFTFKNQQKMMIPDYLDDNEDTIKIITTTEESNKLSESCEYISDFLVTLKYSIKENENNAIIKNKYLNFISEITKILTYDNSKSNILNINTFKVFYYLFKNTLISDKNKEDE